MCMYCTNRIEKQRVVTLCELSTRPAPPPLQPWRIHASRIRLRLGDVGSTDSASPSATANPLSRPSGPPKYVSLGGTAGTRCRCPESTVHSDQPAPALAKVAATHMNRQWTFQNRTVDPSYNYCPNRPWLRMTRTATQRARAHASSEHCTLTGDPSGDRTIAGGLERYSH